MTPQEKITKLIHGYLDMLGDAQADVNAAFESAYDDNTPNTKDYFAALQRQQALAAAIEDISTALNTMHYLISEDK